MIGIKTQTYWNCQNVGENLKCWYF